MEKKMMRFNARGAAVVSQTTNDLLDGSLATQVLTEAEKAMKGWIVRSDGDYLCPKDGDVGFTADLAEAGAFDTEEAAIEAGRDHCDPGYVVMRDPR
ncbi:hypothetical protein [Cupriavidus sp. TMH.W2]|uniref:hypothetical protein n=1 Tax=Cupriavidus sp. TMH.W2 TaxID=3434465 RepID=UPI003D7700D6